jgi:signal transduction histidine kinase
VAIFDDVTARKMAEDQLRQQKELLESTIEALDHPFYVIRAQDYQVEIANNAARELSADGTLTTCYALSHRLDQPCSGPDHLCPLQQVMRLKEPVILEHTHYKANGEPYTVEVRGYPLFDKEGNVERLIEYTLDITERKRLERAAKEAAARTERERLARDLHDAVSQNLFSAGLITELLPELWELDQMQARSSLDKLRQLIRATSAEMRMMMLELRPNSLTDADLDFLLQHLAESLAGRAGISVITRLDPGCQAPEEVKIVLYRVVQEAFNNIARHAQASEVQFAGRCDDGRLAITVRDDGRGFDPATIPPGHLGVGIMRERVAQIGGSIRISSEAGQGTHIVIKWPGEGE